jgi:pilus assembly protein Flp/PilA
MARPMKSLLNRIGLLLRSASGATAIEYALIAGMIALIIIGAVTSIGASLQTPFSDVSDGLS